MREPRGRESSGTAKSPSRAQRIVNQDRDDSEAGFRIVVAPGEGAGAGERRVRFREQLRRSGRVSELPLERGGRSLDQGAQEV